MNIFELEEIVLNSDCDDTSLDSYLVKDENGSVKTHIIKLGLFSDHMTARNIMFERIEEIKDWGETVLGYRVIEHEIDKVNCEFESIIVYTKEGKYLVETKCDAASMNCFRGHGGDIPLKGGDFAWMLCHGRVEPVLVVDRPYTLEEWADKGFSESDVTDDAYTVVTMDNGHEHPLVTHLFPYFGGMSPTVEKKLLFEKLRYDHGEL